LTAAIRDSGLGLQPVADKRERTTAKINSGLDLIAAFYPFDTSADPVVLLSLLEDNAVE
jgi:hypothetical protein